MAQIDIETIERLSKERNTIHEKVCYIFNI